ncbi:hypothetical protein [Woodsholea maritima]|uniref:hypothetical protein n=1 Tax=Woodsholea maritima TaxID=240237 RepID=UPI0003703FF1|nr:hypothetical protein [Woodsholea maritima]
MRIKRVTLTLPAALTPQAGDSARVIAKALAQHLAQHPDQAQSAFTLPAQGGNAQMVAWTLSSTLTPNPTPSSMAKKGGR